MPILNFECEKCGHINEHIQKHSDPSPTKCEKCGKVTKKGLKKVFPTSTNFELKGTGWGIHGYADKF